jgi:hypothetical protein
MPKIIQPSLSGGEVSPAIGARVDISKYKTSLEICENALIQVHGGASNRPGLQYVCECKSGSLSTRIIPFEYNTEQTYILEFGNNYIRFVKDGGQILNGTAKTVSGITAASPGVVTATSHGFSNGDDVYLTGIVGMTQLNGRTVRVASKTTHTFQVHTYDDVGINTSAYTAYSSAGTAEPVYEVATTYATSELFDLKFVQSADVMTIVHKNHAPAELTRTGHAAWTLTDITFAPAQTFPTALLVGANTTGSETERYAVTAVNEETAEESLMAIAAGTAISALTAATPPVVTASGHGLSDLDEVEIQGVVGMVEVNNLRFKVSNKTTNTFELQDMGRVDVVGAGYTAYSSGGTVFPAYKQITNGAATKDNTITWTAVAGAMSYNVYHEKDGIFGFIGRSEIDSFTDDNIDADLEDTPPKFRNPFTGTNQAPSTVGYFKQRRLFGSSITHRQRMWLTQTANHYNLGVSSPTKDDDAITVTIASLQVNEIRHMVSLGELIVLTSGGEWQASGVDGVVTPTTFQIEPQTYYGSEQLQPITAGDVVLYMQPGWTVRDLAYKFETDSYNGNDVSILARHMFDEYTFPSWTYTQAPHSIIWAVRSDGTMLGMTYVREQEVFAWTRHITQGDFKSVASIQEGDDDFLYAVVQRKIGTRTRQYIERLFDRDSMVDVQDAFFVDSGLSLDTPITITGYTNANPVVVTAAAHGLSDGDTIDIAEIYIDDTSTNQGRSLTTTLSGLGYTVANKTTNTFEVQLNAANVDGSTAATFGVYNSGGEVRRATTTVGGLWHLEGASVVGLANGYVTGSLTVANGSVTLPNAASRVHIGLNYTMTIKTLKLDNANLLDTVQARNKKATRMTLRVEDTMGMWHGPDLDHMRSAKFGLPLNYGQPLDMITGDKDVTLSPSWNKDGQFIVQQRDPLPITVLAIIPDVLVGGD